MNDLIALLISGVITLMFVTVLYAYLKAERKVVALKHELRMMEIDRDSWKAQVTPRYFTHMSSTSATTSGGPWWSVPVPTAPTADSCEHCGYEHLNASDAIKYHTQLRDSFANFGDLKSADKEDKLIKTLRLIV